MSTDFESIHTQHKIPVWQPYEMWPVAGWSNSLLGSEGDQLDLKQEHLVDISKHSKIESKDDQLNIMRLQNRKI